MCSGNFFSASQEVKIDTLQYEKKIAASILQVQN